MIAKCSITVVFLCPFLLQILLGMFLNGQEPQQKRLYCEVASNAPSSKDPELRPRINVQSDESGLFVLASLKYNAAFQESMAIAKGIPTIAKFGVLCYERVDFSDADVQVFTGVKKIEKLRIYFQDSSSTMDWKSFQPILSAADGVEIAAVGVPSDMIKSFLGKKFDKADLVRFDILKPVQEKHLAEVNAIIEAVKQEHGLQYHMKLGHQDEDRISIRFTK